MNVYLEPQGLHSRSMLRTARALERYAPSGIHIVQRQEDADLVILHVIGADAIERANVVLAVGKRYCAIQYCLKTAGASLDKWLPFWKSAELVMSYYDLSPYIGQFNFYIAPLGIDDVFKREFPNNLTREKLVVTSGYVSGPCSEAIEEVWIAAERAGVKAIHIGPSQVEGMVSYPRSWNSVQDISDEELADLYRRATWVSALRQVEGFELPGLEGYGCGAKPIAFDQPSMDRWYRNLSAILLPSCSGEKLVDLLTGVFYVYPEKPEYSRWYGEVHSLFDWERICNGFWMNVEMALENAA